MIRIIDEEGYEIKVILNNLNLRVKFYDFMVPLLGSTAVRVVQAPSWLIKTKSHSLLVSGYHYFNTESVRDLVRRPDSKDVQFAINYEENSLDVIEIDESSKLKSKYTLISPREVCIDYETNKNLSDFKFSMTRKAFDDLMERHSEAVLETVTIDDEDGNESIYHLIRVKDYSGGFLTDVIKATSN